jgi:hypothetical protein
MRETGENAPRGAQEAAIWHNVRSAGSLPTTSATIVVSPAAPTAWGSTRAGPSSAPTASARPPRCRPKDTVQVKPPGNRPAARFPSPIAEKSTKRAAGPEEPYDASTEATPGAVPWTAYERGLLPKRNFHPARKCPTLSLLSLVSSVSLLPPHDSASQIDPELALMWSAATGSTSTSCPAVNGHRAPGRRSSQFTAGQEYARDRPTRRTPRSRLFPGPLPGPFPCPLPRPFAAPLPRALPRPTQPPNHAPAATSASAPDPPPVRAPKFTPNAAPALAPTVAPCLTPTSTPSHIPPLPSSPPSCPLPSGHSFQ